MSDEAARTKRKQILVDRTFQHRLSIELMIIVLIVPLVLWANFYMLGQYALTLSPDTINRDGGWGLIGALVKQQWLLIIMLYLFNFAIVYLFIIYYTNRIAGPIYRFSRTLDDMAGGKLDHKIQLRKRDYFENLGASINRLSESFTETVSEITSHVNALAKKVEASGDGEMKQHVAAIRESLSRFEPSEPK